jgi:uncharacterized protein
MTDITTNLTTNVTTDLTTDDFPAEFWLGVSQFNEEAFYACHDTLEAVWIQAPEADKRFYQGILQVAVGLYHLGNKNLRGAVILLAEGSNRLRSYPPDYAQLDLTDFLQQVFALLAHLQGQDPQMIDSLTTDRPKLKRLQTDLDLC